MITEHNIMVGTPAYNGMVHTDYVHSLLSFKNLGINFGFISIGGESLITRGRNSIISRFHCSPEYSHLLFLDGDVRLEGIDLAKMINAQRDVIGAPVPLKTTEDGKPVFNINGNLGQEKGLLKVAQLGTAVMMLSRTAVNALIAHAENNNDVYVANRYARGIGDADKLYDVFKVGVKNGSYLSEDFWVCHTLLELGFDIFVDIHIETRHHGMKSYSAHGKTDN